MIHALGALVLTGALIALFALVRLGQGA